MDTANTKTGCWRTLPSREAGHKLAASNQNSRLRSSQQRRLFTERCCRGRLQRRVLLTPELALAPVSYLARRWSCQQHRRLRLSDTRAWRGSGVVLR
jgi:hypothetical protein